MYPIILLVWYSDGNLHSIIHATRLKVLHWWDFVETWFLNQCSTSHDKIRSHPYLVALRVRPRILLTSFLSPWGKCLWNVDFVTIIITINDARWGKRFWNLHRGFMYTIDIYTSSNSCTSYMRVSLSCLKRYITDRLHGVIVQLCSQKYSIMLILSHLLVFYPLCLHYTGVCTNNITGECSINVNNLSWHTIQPFFYCQDIIPN